MGSLYGKFSEEAGGNDGDDRRTTNEEGFREGFAKGLEEAILGRVKVYRESTALQMISENMDLSLIARVTSLSLIEINQLKAE